MFWNYCIKFVWPLSGALYDDDNIKNNVSLNVSNQKNICLSWNSLGDSIDIYGLYPLNLKAFPCFNLISFDDKKSLSSGGQFHKHFMCVTYGPKE